jgi:hypothetical protein
MTAFVPGFENDLFISYAHEDDARWVHAFADELRDEVSRRLGLSVSIWEDKGRLRAGENWQDAIHDGIKLAAPSSPSSRPAIRTRSGARSAPAVSPRRVHAISATDDFKAVKHTLPTDRFSGRQDVDSAGRTAGAGFSAGTKGAAVRKLADVDLVLRKMRRSNRARPSPPIEECRQRRGLAPAPHPGRRPTDRQDSSFGEGLILEDMDKAIAFDQSAQRGGRPVLGA